MKTRSIRELHIEKQGKVSDKWESYLDYYDELFEVLRDKEISMLEVGVQNGGSLETWSQYFASGKNFIGCDIDENCSKLQYGDSRIKIVVGDVNTQEAYRQIISICPSFGLIIDDGSHQSLDILNTFVNYFPLVEPAGLFVIEDTHCVYSKGYGGGILNENSAQSFFKKLTDVVSYEWWREDVDLNVYLQGFFPKDGLPAFVADGWIESISFRNSIITIKKSRQPGHGKLGKRMVSGSDMIVQNWGGARLV